MSHVLLVKIPENNRSIAVVYILCFVRFNDEQRHIVEVDAAQYDAVKLSASYHHIINVHGCFLSPESRARLREFVQSKVGQCTLKERCVCIANHTNRHRRKANANRTGNSEQSQQIEGGADNQVLIALLNSLHCYLIHDNLDLYRIKRVVLEQDEQDEQKQDEHLDDEEDEKSRFTTKTIEKDEEDEFVQFLKNHADEQFVQRLQEFLKQEEYDWEAIIADMDCAVHDDESEESQTAEFDARQSNIFSFLINHNKQHLVPLLYEQYINVYDMKVIAINFGESVLNWFDDEYRVKPQYASLEEELKANLLEYEPTLFDAHQTFSEWKRECALILAATMDELLCLKAYTNTNRLCSTFRSCFWSTATDELRRRFYWWATTMHQTHLYHARPLDAATTTNSKSKNKQPIQLYHGVNRLFAINDSFPRYNGPVSTTAFSSVAEQFSDAKGLMWFIMSSYEDPLNLTRGLDVTWISAFKNESEILLSDQYIKIGKATNYSQDKSALVDQLLYQLQIYEKEITNKASFYQALGFRVKADDEEMMKVMRKHALLLKRCQFGQERKVTVLERLVEELGITALLNEYRVFTASLVGIAEFGYCCAFNTKLDHLDTTTVIDASCCDETEFKVSEQQNESNAVRVYANDRIPVEALRGADDDDEDAVSVYDLYIRNRRLFGDRFVLAQKEIEFAAPVSTSNAAQVFVTNLYVDDGDNHIKARNVSSWKLSEYIFALKPTERDDEVYTFQDVQQFAIPLKRRVAVDLLAKHKTESVCYHKISSFVAYKFVVGDDDDDDNAVYLHEKIEVGAFNETFGDGGKLEIVHSGNIVVRSRGVIDASGCGLSAPFSKFYSEKKNHGGHNCKDEEKKDGQKEQPLELVLKRGGFSNIGDVEEAKEEKEAAAHGFGGGVIVMESVKGQIVNEGEITADALSTSAQCQGGNIVILTHSLFINKGRISCRRGKIWIFCAECRNEGEITPQPTIIRNSPQTPKISILSDFHRDRLWLLQTNDNKQTQQKITLKLYEHRGHEDDDSPDNLLVEGTDKRYWSKLKIGVPPNEDWLIFQAQSGMRPQSIRIRNYWNSEAIRSLELWIGSSLNEQKFYKLAKTVTDIKKGEYGKEEKQSFDLVLLNYTDYFVARNWSKFDLLKVNIIQNHGNPNCNQFYEFEVFGDFICGNE